MAEHVVEHIGLLQIVDLVGPADEAPGDKAAVCKVLEEHFVRRKARHGDDAPAGQGGQLVGKFGEVGDAGPGEMEDVEAPQKGRDRAANQLLRLAREQAIPQRVLGVRICRPVLRNGPVVLGDGRNLRHGDDDTTLSRRFSFIVRGACDNLERLISCQAQA